LIIAIDFDNTIANTTNYPEIGGPVKGALAGIRELHSKGHYIILWTCREDAALDDAYLWLYAHNVCHAFKTYNRNHPDLTEQYGNDSRKIGADIYIDDKAVGCPKVDGVVDWDSILRYIEGLE
jgi:hypothetical protein